MARIRIADELHVNSYEAAVWFEQVEPCTMWEGDFESRVIAHAPDIYPDYFVFPFKKPVESAFATKTPDLIFISRDYKEWRLVEIEMSYHSLGHIESQIQAFSDAVLGSEHIDYICRNQPDLDRTRLEHLIDSVPQGVLVIVNEPIDQNWIKVLKRYRADVAIFELFRSNDDTEIFRVNGDYPIQIVEHVSGCKFHPLVGNWLVITDHNKLGLPRGGEVKIIHRGCVTRWERIHAHGDVLLRPIQRNPLNTQKDYIIFRRKDGMLVIQIKE